MNNKKVSFSKPDMFNFPLLLIVALTCGGTSREECTYLTQPATIPTSCVYNICPVENNICRIRYDFTVRVHINSSKDLPKNVYLSYDGLVIETN